MGDRYHFDQEFNIENYRKNYFDDKFLSTEEDARISARRQARKEKAGRKVKAKCAEDVIKDEEIKKKKRIKINRTRIFFSIVVFAAVIAFVAVSGAKLTGLKLQKKEAEAKLTALQQKQEQLQAELLELDSDEYIENAARENCHMIREGEVMYVVNPQLESENSDDVIRVK